MYNIIIKNHCAIIKGRYDMGKASTRAQNKYIAKAYDRVNLTLPKGQKDVVQAHAQSRSESVNGFIGRARRWSGTAAGLMS